MYFTWKTNVQPVVMARCNMFGQACDCRRLAPSWSSVGGRLLVKECDVVWRHWCFHCDSSCAPKTGCIPHTLDRSKWAYFLCYTECLQPAAIHILMWGLL